ncbi:TIGR04104 family putative zinc finger protein [Peribacillus sp. NPDC096540]|uniref:TIGR04104 family putative zinc finger protein n=1 Tax=Peribacillus sp. NPDC096540 TaxID=3390612 RepID=UPI003D0142A4
MNLQKCDKCNTQFKWGKISKSLFLAYRPIQCNQCGMKHRITFFSRIIISLLIVPPIWIFSFIISNQLSLSTSYTVSIMIIYSVLISLFFPFLVKYSFDY